MSGQTTYDFRTPKGVAGALVDISPKSIDSRVNSETDINKMRFGMGVVVGTDPGVDVRVPTSTNTAKDFEGVLLNGYTQQMTMNGDVQVFPKQTVGLLRWGRAWGRVADGVSPAYNDPLYLIISGANAGLFTNVAAGNLAIHGRFYGGLGAGNIAPVEIYNDLP